MNNFRLILLLPVLISAGRVSGQNLHTSLYLCPFQAVMFPLPNYRFNLEQSLAKKIAFTGDYSFYSPNTHIFNGLKGQRYDLGLKYFYKSSPEPGGNYKNLFWFSAHYARQEQAVVLGAFNSQSGETVPVDFRRKAEHVFLGTGVNLVYKHWSIDLGLRLGFKKRDVDAIGFTEAEDRDLQLLQGDWMQKTFRTDEQYLPDVLLLFRLGYSIFYF